MSLTRPLWYFALLHNTANNLTQPHWLKGTCRLHSWISPCLVMKDKVIPIRFQISSQKRTENCRSPYLQRHLEIIFTLRVFVYLEDGSWTGLHGIFCSWSSFVFWVSVTMFWLLIHTAPTDMPWSPVDIKSQPVYFSKSDKAGFILWIDLFSSGISPGWCC